MEILPELLKQGIIGLVAGIFFWMYMIERKEHRETREKLESSMDARRLDAKETTETITAPLNSIASGIQLLTDKILINKGEK